MVQPQQAKKGLGVWGWVAIGCVGILVLGGIAVGGAVWWGARKVTSVAHDIANDPTAAIEMALKLNPEIEVIDRDAGSGKVTIRNKRTGETVTMDMEDLKQGRISFESAEGTATFNLDQQSGKMEITTEGEDGGTMTLGGDTQLPSWVPNYPGAVSEGVYNAETPEQVGGTFTSSTTAGLDEVFAYYKGQLEGGGYKVTENRYSGPQGNGGMLVGESADGRRTLTFTMQVTDGKTQVGGMYSEKKG
jgi:hypothetical protein